MAAKVVFQKNVQYSVDRENVQSKMAKWIITAHNNS